MDKNSETNKGDPFWFYKPSILVDKDRLLEFFPVAEMSFNEKLNSIARLSIYLGVLLSTFKLNMLFMYIPLVILLLTYLFEKYMKPKLEKFETPEPSPHNPFMNRLLGEKQIVDSKKHQKLVDSNTEEAFNLNLYQNLGDIFGKENSQRQFFTMPICDQSAFGNWLYGNLREEKIM